MQEILSYNFSRKEVILLCFPPHPTDNLQHLDVSFMCHITTYYEQHVEKTIQYSGKHLNGIQWCGNYIMQTAFEGF